MQPEIGTADSIQKRKPAFDWNDILFRAALPVLAMLAALLIGAVVLLLLKVNPFEAYAAIVTGVFGSMSGFTQSLVKATPLLFVGLGICIAFRASVINIGAEGQIILGALGATAWSLAFRTWPAWLLIPSTLIVSFLSGAVWGFIPGVLKARFRVNEILSTVMMNAIALQLMNLLVRGPLIDQAGGCRRHLPGAVRTLTRSGLVASLDSTNFVKHRSHIGRSAGFCSLSVFMAHHHRIPNSGRRLESGCFALCRRQRGGLSGSLADFGGWFCRAGGSG